MTFLDEAEAVAKRQGWAFDRVTDNSGAWLSVKVSGNMGGSEDTVRVSVWSERSWIVSVSAHACTIGDLAVLSNLAGMAIAVLGCKPKMKPGSSIPELPDDVF